MSEPSQPCARLSQLFPRACESASLESGALAKSDGTFDDSSEQGSIFYRTSSTTSSSSSLFYNDVSYWNKTPLDQFNRPVLIKDQGHNLRSIHPAHQQGQLPAREFLIRLAMDPSAASSLMFLPRGSLEILLLRHLA